MKLRKKIVFIVLLIILFSVIRYREVVYYGLLQLQGQLHIVLNAEPVADVMSRSSTPDSIKYKLAYIQEVRRFAIDSLGLKDSKNYTTFYDQQGKPALWVITACAPFEMKPYEWEFPFLGSVSYKGFFKKERGIPELNEIKSKGFDVDYSSTGGWSTLGWFKDPVLSGMLRRKEGSLAELIIHELTHATLYLPGSVDYNENLATFIGEEGAKRFLMAKFGSNSKEFNEYLKIQQDEEKFGDYMVKSSHRLDSLYQSMDRTKSVEHNSRVKYFFIKDILLNIKKLDLHYPEKFNMIYPGFKIPNNTFFMSYSRYREKQGEFGVELQKFKGNLTLWILNLRTLNK
jgi:predicted aminopeptidase